MFGKFFKDEGGYALTLMLLFLPVFVGIGLLVVDIGRGNNAQSDLQAAADALALAGARELDGREGAIEDAREAMERITNQVGFLSVANKEPVKLTYNATNTDTRPFFVAFLRAIPGDIDPATGKVVPGNDDTPIDSEFVSTYDATGDAATQDRYARYVLVQARSSDLDPFFFLPLTRTAANVPIAATAVAMVRTYTCDLAPMYICNPFGAALDDALASEELPEEMRGKLHRLPVNPSKSTEPGNIGFLRTGNLLAGSGDLTNTDGDGNPGGGTKLLMRALAGGSYEQCISPGDRVYTQPGASPRALDGLNTRFGAYLKGEFGPDGPYYPSLNVRKGWDIAKSDKDCRDEPSNGEKVAQANERLERNPIMSPNVLPLPNGDLWNLNVPAYLTETGVPLTKTADGYTLNGMPFTGDVYIYPAYWPALHGEGKTLNWSVEFGECPSRFDIHKYESAEGFTDKKSLLPQQNGEKLADREAGSPGQCYNKAIPEPAMDRRSLLMAVVDCANESINGSKPINTLGYVKVFLTHPARANANVGTLNVEVYEVFSNFDSGNDNFLRTEVVLVR